MNKNKKSYRILVVEDNPGDKTIVEDFLLEQFSDPLIIHASNFKQTSAILSAADSPFDIILLDLTLTDKDGQHLITEMLQISSSCPIIILTGYTDIDFSIKSISQGIFDYLLKDDLNAGMLYKSIIYAIERKKSIAELKISEKRYSDLFQLSPQPMCLYEQDTFRFIQVNKAAIEQYGYSMEEFLKMTILEFIPEDEKAKTIELITSQKRVLNETYLASSSVYNKSGEILEVETFSTPIIINGKELTLLIAMDVTEKNIYEHKITKAIIKTQEDERYEIGGELHDNVCQILAASQLILGMLKKSLAPPAIPLYTQCLGNIGLALKEIRNLSHRLAPAFFDESTMEEAFRKLFDTFNIQKRSKLLLHIDDAVQQYPISLEIQLNLYRILQEQLRNIQKYAIATSIEVDVLIYNNKLKMRVTDNGIGFNTNTVKSGIGLANMKRRAELFSGKFQLVSSPGNGCTIAIEIPLLEARELKKITWPILEQTG